MIVYVAIAVTLCLIALYGIERQLSMALQKLAEIEEKATKAMEAAEHADMTAEGIWRQMPR
jgi:TRAP-type C4-dicarboxylate transport system permease small subunit